MFYIKKATTSDIAEIGRMAYEVFPETYKDIMSKEQLSYMMSYMYSPETLKKQIDEKSHIYLIAYVDRTPAGYVSITPGGNDLFHLEKIYVLPQYQNTQVGHTLFERSIEIIREMHPGTCYIEMNANRSNSSLGFNDHLAMKTSYRGDHHVNDGYYMNDYILTIKG